MSEDTFIGFLQSQPETAETKQMIEYFKNQLKFKKQTLHFQDKFRVVMSFIKFMRTMCTQANPKIYGSFTRNIFEKLFIHTADIGYGDSVNHDIDIMVYSYKEDYISEIQEFSDFISLLRIISNNSTFDFDFYGFKVVDVIENTIKADDITDANGFVKKFMLNIPHYTIILDKNTMKIKLDLIAYKSQDYEFDSWQNEFNINSLSLSEEGILIKKNSGIIVNDLSYNLFEVINSIMNKNAICNMPFMDIIDGFMHKTRVQKVTILNQIIWFMMNRLKILTLGYTDIYSDIGFFDYKIEKEEICVLSGNNPPYISLKLECGHYISLMGLAGIINVRSSEWSEALKCPMCRKDINIVLNDKKPEKIKIPVQPTRELIAIDKYETDGKLFSEENMEYINHLIRNQSLPVARQETTISRSWVDGFPVPLPHFDPLAPRRTAVHTLVARSRREDYMGSLRRT